MNVRKSRNIASGLLTSLLGVFACVAVAMPAAFAAESGAGKAPPSAAAPAAVPQGGARMTVHVDPKTGAILKEAAPGTVPLTLSPQEQNAMSTSHEGLVQVPSAVPGGGVKVDLQGRFQSPLVGTIGPDGKVRVEHLGEPIEPGHKN